jgi:hypothetical protein
MVENRSVFHSLGIAMGLLTRAHRYNMMKIVPLPDQRHPFF